MEVLIQDLLHIGGEHSEVSGDDRHSDISAGLQEALASTGELGSVSPLVVQVVVYLHEASGR